MNSPDMKLRHSAHRKRMIQEKTRRLEEKGRQPKVLEESYKRKKMRTQDVYIERDREEDE